MDLIRRQDAIDGKIVIQLANGVEIYSDEAVPVEYLKNLPSAQPEIIRCKDCKWWDKSEDSLFGYCMAMKHGYMTANWEIGIYRRYKGDFYCADGERDEAIVDTKAEELDSSAQPEIPPYAVEIEAEYKKWSQVPYIRKPLAKALYEIWKKHDREDAERRSDETD